MPQLGCGDMGHTVEWAVTEPYIKYIYDEINDEQISCRSRAWVIDLLKMQADTLITYISHVSCWPTAAAWSMCLLLNWKVSS